MKSVHRCIVKSVLAWETEIKDGPPRAAAPPFSRGAANGDRAQARAPTFHGSQGGANGERAQARAPASDGPQAGAAPPADFTESEEEDTDGEGRRRPMDDAEAEALCMARIHEMYRRERDGREKRNKLGSARGVGSGRF